MPTTPRDYTLYAAVLAALGTINGAGNYHYTLTSLVSEGRRGPSDPPQASGPCATLSVAALEVVEGPNLAARENTFALIVQAWTPTADSGTARTLAMFRLSSDIRQALWTAIHDTVNALHGIPSVAIRQTFADGATQLSLGNRGLVELEITLSYVVNYDGVE